MKGPPRGILFQKLFYWKDKEESSYSSQKEHDDRLTVKKRSVSHCQKDINMDEEHQTCK